MAKRSAARYDSSGDEAAAARDEHVEEEDDEPRELKLRRLLRRHHALEVGEVAALLETSVETGLSLAEAARRLGVWGPNQLRRSGGVKFHTLVARHLFNFMSFVLMAAFVMACVTQQWIDAGVVAFLIFINIVIGVSQGTSDGSSA
jgi:magnesium-transporting ATPase (P-type)